MTKNKMVIYRTYLFVLQETRKNNGEPPKLEFTASRYIYVEKIFKFCGYNRAREIVTGLEFPFINSDVNRMNSFVNQGDETPYYVAADTNNIDYKIISFKKTSTEEFKDISKYLDFDITSYRHLLERLMSKSEEALYAFRKQKEQQKKIDEKALVERIYAEDEVLRKIYNIKARRGE